MVPVTLFFFPTLFGSSRRPPAASILSATSA
jgi:hypothetical protein